MSDQYRPRRGLLDGLADIVGDLYGENAAANARLSQELRKDSEVPSPAAETAVYSAKPALPPFSALWKTADEPIDWTEALASETPTDGLTAPEKWTLYHQQADAVLLLSILVGNTSSEGIDTDMDFDGKLTIYDCVLLLQYLETL